MSQEMQQSQNERADYSKTIKDMPRFASRIADLGMGGFEKLTCFVDSLEAQDNPTPLFDSLPTEG